MDERNDESGEMEQPLSVGNNTEQEALIKRSTEEKTPLYVYFLTAFAAIGGFLFGYDTGVISGAMILIKQEFHLSYLWQELIVSATVGTAIVGALLGGFLDQWFGRRPMLITWAIVFTTGSVLMGIAYSRELLLFGQLTVGFGVGKPKLKHFKNTSL